jgi:hypothetical protein
MIVLTTATFMTAGQISVNLAKAATASGRQHTPRIMTVTAEGELFVNDRPVSDRQLDATLLTHPYAFLVLVRTDKVSRLKDSSPSLIVSAGSAFARSAWRSSACELEHPGPKFRPTRPHRFHRPQRSRLPHQTVKVVASVSNCR